MTTPNKISILGVYENISTCTSIYTFNFIYVTFHEHSAVLASAE